MYQVGKGREYHTMIETQISQVDSSQLGHATCIALSHKQTRHSQATLRVLSTTILCSISQVDSSQLGHATCIVYYDTRLYLTGRLVITRPRYMYCLLQYTLVVVVINLHIAYSRNFRCTDRLGQHSSITATGAISNIFWTNLFVYRGLSNSLHEKARGF